MTYWQNLQSLIQPLLLAVYPELSDKQPADSSYDQGLLLRFQLLKDLFEKLTDQNEDEQTDAFVQACLLNEIHYPLIHTDLMALARSVLGNLVNEQNCKEVIALNQGFERIEHKVSRAYFHHYLRQLAVKNHIILMFIFTTKNIFVQ